MDGILELNKFNKTNMKLHFSIYIIILIISTSLSVVAQGPISFIQNGQIITVSKNSESIQLEKNPFAIRYFAKQYNSKKEKFYAAQFAVLEKASDTAFAKIGSAIQDIPYFQPGTGLAADENGMYSEIFIANDGHHYLTYESEEDKRAKFISKNNDLLELEWDISGVFYENKDLQFSQLQLSTVYFVVLIDGNLNGKIDKEELKIIQITFKN